MATQEDLQETLEYMTGYSLYAYEEEIRQGFISIPGGHRAGVTGKVILDGNKVRGMKIPRTLFFIFIYLLKNLKCRPKNDQLR